jgi:hypothetical protein
MHIASVGNLKQNDIYVVDGAQELCLLFQNQTAGMWNPETAKLAVNPGPLCVLPKGARALMRNTPLVSQGNPLPAASTGARLYQIYDPRIEANCGSILGAWYAIVYPNGRTFSFYLVGKLAKTEIFTKSNLCDYMMGKTENVHIAWDQVTLASYIALSGDRIILYDNNPGNRFVRSTVILIPPQKSDHIISISNFTYLIPADRLLPLLEKAGFDPIARNAALEQVINSPLPGKIKIQ